MVDLKSLVRTAAIPLALVCALIVAGCGGGPKRAPKRAGGFSRNDAADEPAPKVEPGQPAAPVAPEEGGAPIIARADNRTDRRVTTSNLKPGQSGVEIEGEAKCRGTEFFLKRIPAVDGQPGVVILSTSRQEVNPDYPAVYFIAQLPAGSAENLAGQTAKGRLFVQAQANGPILHSTGSSAEIQFVGQDADFVEGEIFETQLISTEASRRVTVSGAFIATTRETKRRVRQTDATQQEF